MQAKNIKQFSLSIIQAYLLTLQEHIESFSHMGLLKIDGYFLCELCEITTGSVKIIREILCLERVFITPQKL